MRSLRCEQELCPQWTGQGCACDVFGIEKPQWLKCEDCGWESPPNPAVEIPECDNCGGEMEPSR